jgi:hypothetical protein
VELLGEFNLKNVCAIPKGVVQVLYGHRKTSIRICVSCKMNDNLSFSQIVLPFSFTPKAETVPTHGRRHRRFLSMKCIIYFHEIDGLLYDRLEVSIPGCILQIWKNKLRLSYFICLRSSRPTWLRRIIEVLFLSSVHDFHLDRCIHLLNLLGLLVWQPMLLQLYHFV